MGVSIDVWRASIGTFCPLRVCKKKTCYTKVKIKKTKVNLAFWFAVLALLLVIGNVETNPGPEYQCRHCNKISNSLRANSSHQRNAHSMDSKYVFYCAASSCTKEIFLSYKALYHHVWYRHLSVREEEIANRDINVLEQSLCTSEGCPVSLPSLRALCHHLINDHGKKDERIVCPFQDCGRGPFKLTSFRTHLNDYHKGWKNVEPAEQRPLGIEENIFEDFPDHGMDNQEQETVIDWSEDNYMSADDDDAEDNDIHAMAQNFFHQVAKFYLKMETECMLAASSVQTMSTSLAHLQRLNLAIIKKVLLNELQDLDISKERMDSIVTNILYADKMFCVHVKEAPGPTLSTRKLRLAYYKKHFCYVKPVEINLSLDPTSPKTIHVVSIRKTLNELVKCESVKRQINQSFEAQARGERDEDIFKDYRDGMVYQRSESAKKKTIDLIIFQDAFNATKDLGSTADKYDTLGMYFVIGNMHPHIRSKLKSMQLVMLIPKFKEMYKTFKDKCFQHVINELKDLETNGILFCGEIIPVVLQFLVGDNKGQNQIGGFVESFTALNYCRFCPMGRDQIRETPWAVGPLRSKESFNEDLRLFREAKAEGSDIEHMRGVKTDCCFNNCLQEFNSMDPRLCPCIAHDVFEAIINEYDFFPIIESLVERGWFTIRGLNKLIQKFKYSPQDIKNKPVKVRASKLGGHAVQNWTLLRLFPLIIGKERILDAADSHWQLYLKLKEICEYICAPSYTAQLVADMKGLIYEYMQERQEVLGTLPKPKHHFVSHYADLVVLMGPIIHLFTMRFESAHSFFKRVARTCKNFINIGLTMSEKAALYFCYLSTGTFIDEGFLVQDKQPLNKSKYGKEIEDYLIHLNLSAHTKEITSARVDSVEFKKGCWILLGNAEENDNEIVIGHTQCLLFENGEVKILFSTHRATLWDEYGLYTIDSKCLNYKCMPVKDLSYPISQSVYNFYGKQCFSLKHILSTSVPKE
ncbi:uncharacterized protein LOC113206767 [Frankliniella occidentalis]|uniref:Uncharacterized protein LOC113206767 n=1 Tax=Frankliniella occidentalis TaxID=133901 RepID=A0A6J1SDN2_FRAOC|nr:uncharacterized protein LOC113206767 [Frankliniella occidentalis]XP_052126417.1 uncharacterized protein LOC113206767 [Frankliniella occidentalis]XP_052126418.1 uncharacterized protein LOC113206767 [Frankliniella occidentalis]XP_052126419.1 uncharacterized protein LOC113206767 [Frankliniella occidentalis]XP_052126420.1 uncharacterized protein LOC113206767 [Frankliniella occidentalis]